MGDTTATSRAKELAPPQVQSPILTATNYTVWAMRMEVLLNIYDVWETIDPGIADAKKNSIAKALLFQAIPESLVLQVGEQNSPKGIWNAIKTRNMGAEKVKGARLETLMMDFDRLKMHDNETIDSFVGRISEISTKTASLGKTIEENKLVRKFLNCLPRSKYIHMIASIEQWVDLDTVSFQEIIGRIKVFEERTVDQDVGEDRGKLMYAAAPNQNRGGYGGHHGGRTSSNQAEETGGQGRGSNSSRRRGKRRGRGRGRSNGQTRENSGTYEKEKKDMSKIRC